MIFFSRREQKSNLKILYSRRTRFSNFQQIKIEIIKANIKNLRAAPQDPRVLKEERAKNVNPTLIIMIISDS